MPNGASPEADGAEDMKPELPTLFVGKQFWIVEELPVYYLSKLKEDIKNHGGSIIADRTLANIILYNPPHSNQPWYNAFLKEKEALEEEEQQVPIMRPYYWFYASLFANPPTLLGVGAVPSVAIYSKPEAELGNRRRPLKIYFSLNLVWPGGSVCADLLEKVALKNGGMRTEGKHPRRDSDVLILNEDTAAFKGIVEAMEPSQTYWTREWFESRANTRIPCGVDMASNKFTGTQQKAKRTDFTQQDDDNLCRYFAYMGDDVSWQSRKTFQDLLDDPRYPWAQRHTVESWKERVKKKPDIFRTRVPRFRAQGVDVHLRTRNERRRAGEFSPTEEGRRAEEERRRNRGKKPAAREREMDRVVEESEPEGIEDESEDEGSPVAGPSRLRGVREVQVRSQAQASTGKKRKRASPEYVEVDDEQEEEIDELATSLEQEAEPQRPPKKQKSNAGTPATRLASNSHRTPSSAPRAATTAANGSPAPRGTAKRPPLPPLSSLKPAATPSSRPASQSTPSRSSANGPRLTPANVPRSSQEGAVLAGLFQGTPPTTNGKERKKKKDKTPAKEKRPYRAETDHFADGWDSSQEAEGEGGAVPSGMAEEEARPQGLLMGPPRGEPLDENMLPSDFGDTDEGSGVGDGDESDVGAGAGPGAGGARNPDAMDEDVVPDSADPSQASFPRAGADDQDDEDDEEEADARLDRDINARNEALKLLVQKQRQRVATASPMASAAPARATSASPRVPVAAAASPAGKESSNSAAMPPPSDAVRRPRASEPAQRPPPMMNGNPPAAPAPPRRSFNIPVALALEALSKRAAGSPRTSGAVAAAAPAVASPKAAVSAPVMVKRKKIQEVPKPAPSPFAAAAAAAPVMNGSAAAGPSNAPAHAAPGLSNLAPGTPAMDRAPAVRVSSPVVNSRSAMQNLLDKICADFGVDFKVVVEEMQLMKAAGMPFRSDTIRAAMEKRAKREREVTPEV